MKRWTFLRRSPWSIRIAAVVLALMLTMAAFPALLATHDPTTQDLLGRLLPPGSTSSLTGYHLLGTDQLGRDVYSRMAYGSRVSITFAIIGTVVGLFIGTVSGIVAGYLGGRADQSLMFMVDAQQSIPFIVLCFVGIAIFGSSTFVLIPLIGLAGWEGYARYARAGSLSARNSQYVLASQALGAPSSYIIRRHVLPNMVAPIIVIATLNVTGVILLESSLSFLGIGVQPPTPTWGNMISEGREYLGSAWWMPIVPGGAMVATTLSIVLVGDWLRDVLDPAMRQR
jgi:peptide/nickel transport system permease protein